jgi:hypothetical protein
MTKKIAALLFFLPALAFAKTLVFTTAFNRPDFVELQQKLFNKFLEDDFEYIVVSDANTLQMRETMKQTCERLKIRLIEVPQGIHDRPYLPRQVGDNFHNPNVRHCNSAQWAWDTHFSNHEGPVMLIDSDMFLIRPFSVEKTLEDKHLAGVMWGTTDSETNAPYSYLWLALILFNNPKLPEKERICFNPGALPGTKAVCDSGGWTSLYLKRFGEILKVHNLSYLQGHQFYCPYRYASVDSQKFENIREEEIRSNLESRGFTRNEINLALKKPYTIELLGDNHFLHYRAGTNYENYSDEFLQTKDQILLEFFETILK